MVAEPRLDSGLLNQSRAPLKPSQRWYALRHVLLPRITYALTLGRVGKGDLKRFDIKIRGAVGGWLNMPQHTLKEMFHAPVTAGGLGIWRLEHQVKVWQQDRLRRFVARRSDQGGQAPAKRWVRRQPSFKADKKVINKKLMMGTNVVTNGRNVQVEDSKTLRKSADGRGLAHHGNTATETWWMTDRTITDHLSGKEFVSANLLRQGLLPTPRRRCRLGVDVAVTRCPLCGEKGAPGIGHILQRCKSVKRTRQCRHNRICQHLRECLEGAGYVVESEPRVDLRSGGCLRPDIIAYNTTLRTAVALDVAVCGTRESPEVATLRKTTKYSHAEVEEYALRQLTGGGPNPLFSSIGVAVNYRGALSKSSERMLLGSTNLGKQSIAWLPFLALKGGNKIYRDWSRKVRARTNRAAS